MHDALFVRPHGSIKAMAEFKRPTAQEVANT